MCHKWRIELNESKSNLITCSTRNNTTNLPAAVNEITVKRENKVMILDVKSNGSNT